MTTENHPEPTPEQRQAWLTEYQVCSDNNISTGDTYWMVASIFFAISSGLLAAIIGGVLANDSLFNSLFCNNEPRKTLTVGIIALILAIANIIILKKLKGWQKRIRFNQSKGQERMREIELLFGMSYEWRIHAIDKYHKWLECFKRKESKLCDKQIWKKVKRFLEKERNEIFNNFINEDNLTEKSTKAFNKTLKEIENEIFLQCPKEKKCKRESDYEPPSSCKHYPWIINTIIALWVLVLVLSVFLIILAYPCWGLIILGIILILLLLIYLKTIWGKLKNIPSYVACFMKFITHEYRKSSK